MLLPMPRVSQRLLQPTVCCAQSSGFTLIESLMVIVIIAILALIGWPSLRGFLEQRKINASQHLLYQALRATQMDAMQESHNRQFSLRQRDDQVEWASHPVSVAPTQVALWNPLIDGVVLAEEDNTLPQSGNIYYVRFNFQGDVQYRLGTVTLKGSGGRHTHRCVIVSTLIGAMRQGQGQTKPNSNDRYCY